MQDDLITDFQDKPIPGTTNILGESNYKTETDIFYPLNGPPQKTIDNIRTRKNRNKQGATRKYNVDF